MVVAVAADVAVVVVDYPVVCRLVDRLRTDMTTRTIRFRARPIAVDAK